MSDFLSETAFRRFKFFEDNIKVVPVLFGSDIGQGDVMELPNDSDLEKVEITGIGTDFGGEEVFSAKNYVVNNIVYNVLTFSQLALFNLTLIDGNAPVNSDKLILDKTPLNTLTATGIWNVGNFVLQSFWAAKFRFTTVTSFITKTSATPITAPYCILLLFSYNTKSLVKAL